MDCISNYYCFNAIFIKAVLVCNMEVLANELLPVFSYPIASITTIFIIFLFIVFIINPNWSLVEEKIQCTRCKK